MTQIYEIGGSWGNSIEWEPGDQFDEPGGSEFTVCGWKPCIPKVGDYLEGNFKKGRVRFKFIEVERMDIPHDMFFGTVKVLCYVEDES